MKSNRPREIVRYCLALAILILGPIAFRRIVNVFSFLIIVGMVTYVLYHLVREIALYDDERKRWNELEPLRDEANRLRSDILAALKDGGEPQLFNAPLTLFPYSGSDGVLGLLRFNEAKRTDPIPDPFSNGQLMCFAAAVRIEIDPLGWPAAIAPQAVRFRLLEDDDDIVLDWINPDEVPEAAEIKLVVPRDAMISDIDDFARQLRAATPRIRKTKPTRS